MFKLSHPKGTEWEKHSHRRVFHLPEAVDASPRIIAGVPDSDPEVMLRLARTLEGPLILLYVLHTSRGEAETGRYQSPDLDRAELEGFFDEFWQFLSTDARFDLWVHAPDASATLVWDRHDLLHAYGPLDRFAAELEALGFEPGQPEVPAHHAHHYHAEQDALAKRLIARFDWRCSPLRPEDVQ